ncbi:NAD(P)-dependent oxidoreductase [Cellulomonas sp. S1-8]|uniref:NAD(P)-dependent oxidoreductase n=1 Tax=Cellulomonas sp. S1-8 TaxID=2904790 RepID=UPI002243A590|nr:NAD(P)H-binding protein [Cellulomonas sp. S1-8]UZN03320.1 NAD(P)H-binding protein [Cellulomonas sp. S1-8]
MGQNVSQMRIVVLGASGATGGRVVGAALDRGHRVVAVVRRHGALPAREGMTKAVWTDVADTRSLVPALRGADAVVSALGGAPKGPTTVCTDALRTVVPAMRAADVRRLVVVSAHGVAESRDRSLYVRAVWAGVADRMRDKEAMEQLVTASGLDWTLVRPPALADGPATRGYRTGERLPIRLWSRIARADLADFLVREVETPAFLRGLPRIAR